MKYQLIKTANHTGTRDLLRTFRDPERAQEIADNANAQYPAYTFTVEPAES